MAAPEPRHDRGAWWASKEVSMTISTLSAELEPELPRERPWPEHRVSNEPTWAARQLAELPADVAWPIARRALLGVALASSYGLAVGLIGGVGSMARHASWAACSLVMVVGMAVPALHVLLALFDLPVAPMQTAERASHALFRTGLVLAGVAPAVALYAATTDADVVVRLGLLAFRGACALGLSGFVLHMLALVNTRDSQVRFAGQVALAGFVWFCIALTGRIAYRFAVQGGAS
jgi:hypothetical protein